MLGLRRRAQRVFGLGHRRDSAGPVLCIGEGEGRNALFLASRGYAVEAFDVSAVGLVKARALAEERHLTLRTTVADLAHYDFGQRRWSGIVSIFCHLLNE